MGRTSHAWGVLPLRETCEVSLLKLLDHLTCTTLPFSPHGSQTSLFLTDGENENLNSSLDFSSVS